MEGGMDGGMEGWREGGRDGGMEGGGDNIYFPLLGEPQSVNKSPPKIFICPLLREGFLKTYRG